MSRVLLLLLLLLFNACEYVIFGAHDCCDTQSPSTVGGKLPTRVDEPLPLTTTAAEDSTRCVCGVTDETKSHRRRHEKCNRRVILLRFHFERNAKKLMTKKRQHSAGVRVSSTSFPLFLLLLIDNLCLVVVV